MSKKSRNGTPVKAIRGMCLDCSNGSPKDARLCSITACPLWPWRMGRRPDTLARTARSLLDRCHLQLAGVIDAELANMPASEPWNSRHDQSAMRLSFGGESASREIVARLLRARRSGVAEPVLATTPGRSWSFPCSGRAMASVSHSRDACTKRPVGVTGDSHICEATSALQKGDPQ
jgi:hypothetical protein